MLAHTHALRTSSLARAAYKRMMRLALKSMRLAITPRTPTPLSRPPPTRAPPCFPPPARLDTDQSHQLLSAYSTIHNYYIVENGDAGKFFDIDGSEIAPASQSAEGLVRVAVLDLDR